jgi:hypothetical protein
MQDDVHDVLVQLLICILYMDIYDHMMDIHQLICRLQMHVSLLLIMMLNEGPLLMFHHLYSTIHMSVSDC